MKVNIAKWPKRAVAAILAVLLAITFLPFSNFNLVTAKAAVSDAPATQKNLYDNGDGTYTLSLSVTGEAATSSTTEVTKANVILVLDTSSSMNIDAGTAYYPVVGTPRNPAQDGNSQPTYYRLVNGQYQQLYYRGGQWRIANSGTAQVFSGQFYCRSRLWAEKDALTKDGGIIDNLLTQNVPGDPVKSDIIEVSVISFDMDADLRQAFTTNKANIKNTINGLVTESGTNWEEALQEAKDQADTIKAAQPEEAVYVIFLTDGQPSVDAIGGGGQDHNIANNNTGWHNAWNQAQDDARAIVQAGYKFYSLFTWGDNNYASYLQGLVLRAYTGNTSYNYDSAIPAGSEYAQYYANANSTEALIEALNQIVHDITESVGYTNVELEDGVTAMTTSNIKTQPGGTITGLKYYRAGGSYGTFNPEQGQYGTLWADAPDATQNSEGEVDWNLGDIVLEDGVTYTATFVVWPSQESLDLVADLNNGIKSYDSLTPAEKSQISVSAGHYYLKTNTDYPQVTYSTVTTTTVDGVPTTVVSDPQTATITNPDPVGLAEEKLNAKKIWEDDLDPSQREEVGNSVELYLMMDGQYYYLDPETGDPMSVTLKEDEEWTETDYLAIAPGIMVTEDSPAYDPDATQVEWDGVKYAILEKGHDYVWQESDINNHFELTAYTHHPMIMGSDADGNPITKDVVFEEDAEGNILSIISVADMGDTLSATNTLKPGINVQKKVVDEDNQEIDVTDPFEVTVYLCDEEGNALPNKKTTDGETTYTIDYRIYYGPNNPNYDESAGGGRSDHIYKTGTSFTEEIYVGDVLRVVNVEAGALFRVEEEAANIPDGYEFIDAGYEIKYGTEEYAADTDTVTLNNEEFHVTKGNSASQVTVTNRKLIETTVVKVWDDANNQDGIRPDSLEVVLKANGTTKETVTLNATGNWTATVKGLPKYDANDEPITYTWEEVSVPDGYEQQDPVVSGTTTTLTNKHTPEVTEATVKKVWDDANDQDGARPESLTVTLSNGTEVTLNADNNWTATVKDLPKYANGQEIKYTWTETVPTGYTMTSNTTQGTVTTITNKHTPEQTEATVKKVWDDADDQDGKRPETLTVQLNANGSPVEGKTVTLNATNNWQATVLELPKYANGQEITYTWTETVPDGYEMTGNTKEGTVTTITNTHTPELIELTVKKVWNDADDQDGKRPTSLIVKLMNGETEVGSVTLSADNEWTDKISNLPKYANKTEIQYSWSEDTLPEGYSLTGTSVDEETKTITTLTNSYTPTTTEATVKKVWVDKDDQDGIRPESLTVQLYANGSPVSGKTVTLNEQNNWEAKLDNLPENQAGKPIEYTWTEIDLPEGYELTNTSVNGTITTLTNTHIPETVNLKVIKAWDDEENQYGTRPSSLTVTLLKDNAEYGTYTLNAEGEWSQLVEGLPKYRDKGTPIVYSWTETEPTGYKLTSTSDPTDEKIGDKTYKVTTLTNTPQWGGLSIQKDLTVYNNFVNQSVEAKPDPVTFVFEVSATLQSWSYTDYFALTFYSDENDTAMQKTIDLGNIFPVGAEVTVTEVDYGAGYTCTGRDFVKVTIVADDEATEETEVATAAFTNAYDNKIKNGWGIQNHYSDVKYLPEETLR